MVAVAEKPLTAKECYLAQMRWRREPIAFQTECLDTKPEHVWVGMRRMAESVRDNRKTCVEAGHSVSKDYEAARLALWFLAAYGPRCTVVVTGPGNNQVENVFFREVADAYNNAKIPYQGKLTSCKIHIDDKWFMLGFVSAEDVGTDENTRFQGFHNEYVLLIFTEAAGVPVSVWNAAQGLIISDKHRWLVYGNPTKAQGPFADAAQDPSFNHIIISVKDTPNFKEGREVIPGVSGREYEADIRRRYGEDSNEYKIRVLGQRPEFTAGTYLGLKLAKAEKEGRVGDRSYEETMPVFTFWDLGDMYTACGFVQYIGQEIRLIDFFYDSEGKGLPAYALMLQERKYKYGGHYSLPDIFPKGSNQKMGFSGQYTIEAARKLGIDFRKIELPDKDSQVRAAQDIMDLCHWSEKARQWYDGLLDWRKRKNEALSTTDKPVYFEDSLRNWGRHVGDMTCGLAIAYRYMSIGGQIRGRLVPTLPDLGTVKISKPRILTQGLKGVA